MTQPNKSARARGRERCRSERWTWTTERESEGGREGAAGKPIKNYMPSNNAPTERAEPAAASSTYVPYGERSGGTRTPSNYFYLFFAFGSSLSLSLSSTHANHCHVPHVKKLIFPSI